MSQLAFYEVGFAFDPARPVLREVSFVVEPGEFVAVVGPNGSGKTTLLRLASGLLLPDTGTVLLDGTPIDDIPRRLLARQIAGVAAQEDVRFPYTVRDTVALGRHPWRGAFGGETDADRALIDEALDDADLVAIKDRPLPSLSSGERQRAALARCLVQEGGVILLDEPTSHLDLGHRVRLLDVIRRRGRARGQAVLAVLHDLNLAAAFADQVVLLVDGRVDADGAPSDVLTETRVRDAFAADVHVMPHPGTGSPVIVPEVGGSQA